MAKDKYYFRHDYNARNDRKIAALIIDYKSSGYGIFQAIVEMMHEEDGDLEYDDITFNAIAKDLNETVEYIKEVIIKCIDKYKLFVIDQNSITSNRVKRNLTERGEKSKLKSESGRLGGINSGLSRRSVNKTKQNEAVLKANKAQLEANEQKEIKGEEIKGKEIIINDSSIFSVSTENTVISKMSKVWLTYNPNYQFDNDMDSAPLLQLAYKIAKYKKWQPQDVLNGKMDECSNSWESIVKFIKNSDFYKKLELKTIEKQWAGLCQTMQADNEKLNPSKKQSGPYL